MAPDDKPVLRLRAEDSDDLMVVSACLQDALVAVCDLRYFAEERDFVLVANRFRWESGVRDMAGETGHQRVLCAVTFSTVDNISYRGFRRTDEDRILCLLAIRSEATKSAGAVIILEFAGAAAIRIEADRVLCRAKDLGEPWPTPWRPSHGEDAER